MMTANISDPVGALWLMSYAGVEPVFPLYVISSIGGRRETIKDGDFCHNIYQGTMRPTETIAAHLQFHIRHEIVHLELLFRLFQKIGGDEVQQWINNEPTGQYARRTAFLYEWLTAGTLEVPVNLGGNYVDALNPKKLVTSSPAQVVKNARWRVNANLAGSPNLCPMLVKTEGFVQAASLNISDMVDKLADEFGEDLLMRASVWMTLRESRANFAIEGEGHEIKRVERFADVMARRTGKADIPLTPTLLAELQQEILGSKTIIQKYGLRQSPFLSDNGVWRDIQIIVVNAFKDDSDSFSI